MHTASSSFIHFDSSVITQLCQNWIWGKKGSRSPTATGEAGRDRTVPAILVRVAVSSLAITSTLVPITLKSTEPLGVAESGSVDALVE